MFQLQLKTYIFYAFKSVVALSRVQTAITVFVEQLCKDVVSVSDVAVTIKVVADVGHLLLMSLLNKLGQRFARVGTGIATPPLWHFYLV